MDNWKNIRMIIVDDSPKDVMILTECFHSVGVELISNIRSLRELPSLLESVSNQIPYIVFISETVLTGPSDLVTLVKDGIPFVVTHSNDAGNVMEALRLGAHDILTKPISPKLLEDKLVQITRSSLKTAA